jgi:hypothetical protein
MPFLVAPHIDKNNKFLVGAESLHKDLESGNCPSQGGKQYGRCM